MILEWVEVGAIDIQGFIMGTNCYLIGSDLTKEIIIIDPGAEPHRIIDTILKLSLKPIAIVLTHAHVDHTRALRKVKKHFYIPLWYHEKEYRNPILMKADRWLKEGDIVKINDVELKVLETPGHSQGSITLWTESTTEFQGKTYDGGIIVGDTIFYDGLGRTDHEQGDRDLLLSSIITKILCNPAFSEECLILPGHATPFPFKNLKINHPLQEYF